MNYQIFEITVLGWGIFHTGFRKMTKEILIKIIK